MNEKSILTKEKIEELSNSDVTVIYGKENLKDIIDSLLEKLFIREIEKMNN